MSIEPLTKIALSTAAKIAVGKVAALLPNNARAVDEAYTAMLQDMVLAVEAAFRAHLAHHEEKDPDFARRVAAALDEREARALFYRLGTEAALATTTERVRMLAHALAGIYTPDLGAEVRSRVSRAVLMLEPSDVVALREAIKAGEGKTGPDQYAGAPMLPLARGYSGLIVAGCVAEANVWDGGLYVTELGRAVAKALELWREEQRDPGARKPPPAP